MSQGSIFQMISMVLACLLREYCLTSSGWQREQSLGVTTAATGTGIAIGTSVANVGPGGTATYTAGNNVVLTQNGTSTTFAVNANPSFTTVTVGNTNITNNGVSIANGPSLTVNGINLRTFGSQGQQRTGVLSLKLAELEFGVDKAYDTPLIEGPSERLQLGRGERIDVVTGEVFDIDADLEVFAEHQPP